MIMLGAPLIIFTASLLSFQGGITVPGYAAAKGGVAQLTKALANEWAGRNVQVNAIAPGYIATDNTEALRADPVRNPAIVSRIPAGRWGDGATAVRPVAAAGVAIVSGASSACRIASAPRNRARGSFAIACWIASTTPRGSGSIPRGATGTGAGCWMCASIVAIAVDS